MSNSGKPETITVQALDLERLAEQSMEQVIEQARKEINN